jgi:serine/threonine protein kinase
MEKRRYRVVRTVGKGGFGTVYRAELLGAGGFTKLVALKVLNADMEGSEKVARRFRDEARVLGLIHHRAIVQVDGLVKLDGRWTVVMEFVEGIDLRKVIKAAGPIPPAPALEIVREITGALHVAYLQEGPDGRPLHLLHRDIKPSNLQITQAGELKILDFGIARAEFAGREEVTVNRLMIGSAEYMSPERLDANDGPEGDIYAVGTVLFEMLVGERFGRTSLIKSRHEQHVAERIKKLGAIARYPEVVQLIREMVDHDPRKRPTARDVERRVPQLLKGVEGEALRDWAERVIPPLVAARYDRPSDELSGSVLTEDEAGIEPVSSSVPATAGAKNTRKPAPEAAKPAPKRRSLFAPLAALGLFGMIVAGGLVLAVLVVAIVAAWKLGLL